MPALAGLLLLAVVAIACHGWPYHITTIHSASQFETVCIDRNTTEVTFAEAKDAISDILNSPVGWNSRSSITFAILPDDCDTYSPAEMEDIELFYRVNSGGNYAPCSNPAPCAQSIGSCIDHDTFFCDFTQFRIVLSSTEIDETGIYKPLEHVINHETGHAVGLDDPILTPIGVGYDRCQILVDGEAEWIDSIMHNAFQCEEFVESENWWEPRNRSYPSSDDFQSVDTIGEWGQ